MRKIVCGILCLSLAGCGKSMDYSQANADEIYGAFQAKMAKGRYDLALEAGQALAHAHPASEHVNDVRVGVLEAHVNMGHYEVANKYADRLLKSKVIDPSVLEKVSYFKIIANVKHSQHWTVNALTFLNLEGYFTNADVLSDVLVECRSFLESYPESEYAEEIAAIEKDVTEFLVSHEAEVAEYYRAHGREKAYEARIARLEAILSNASGE